MDSSQYCRELEAHLCRKNGGHLVRIVGPTFEKVCGWAAMGVPLSIACRGIDQYCERYYAKGPRRRPVRVEFCEADILELFDRWRRAVGVPAADPDQETADASHAHRGSGLPQHLDRVLTRLTAVRTARPEADALGRVLDDILDELGELRAVTRSLRGEARVRAFERLRERDRQVASAARGAASAADVDAAHREAAVELSPFRARMTHEAWRQSVEAAVDRLLRERLGLPRITP